MNDPVQNPFLTPGAPDVDQPSGSLAAQLRVGQIITFALVQGLLIMAAILTYMTLSDGNKGPPVGVLPGNGGDVVLPAIGIAAAVLGGVAAVVIPANIRRRAAIRFQAQGETIDPPIDVDAVMSPAIVALVGASQSATIVGQAILEGVATLNLILMLLDGRLFYLAIVAVCMIGIVMQTPTKGKLKETIENASVRF